MKENQKQEERKPWYKKWWVWVLAVLFIIIIIPGEEDSPSTSPSVVDTSTTQVIKKEAIEYTTLRKWNPDNDSLAIGLEILIDPRDVSKENIITLIESISSRLPKVVVKVYQSEEAWEAETNQTYGDIYNQGYLAFYVKNTTDSGAYRGFNEIRWFQAEGKLENLLGTKTQINN